MDVAALGGDRAGDITGGEGYGSDCDNQDLFHSGFQLGVNRIAVVVVVAVEFVHCVAEEGTDLGLGFVLGLQFGFFGRIREDCTNSGDHFGEALFRFDLRSGRRFGGWVAEFSGGRFAGLLVGAEIHIGVHAHLFSH